MINLKKQSFGDEILVEISGDNRNSVVQQFWSFWNHEATNGEFSWTNDGFGGKYCGYFWTNEDRLRKSCREIELNKLVGANGEITKELEDYSCALGETMYNSIINEIFYKITPNGSGGYKLIENKEIESETSLTCN